MSPEWIGFLGIVAMLFLLTLRMPIGIAMLLVGSVGFAILNGPQQALMALARIPIPTRLIMTSPSFRSSC